MTTDPAHPDQSMQDILASIRSLIAKSDAEPEPVRPGRVADALAADDPVQSSEAELLQLAQMVRDEIEAPSDQTISGDISPRPALNDALMRGYDGADKTLEGVVADLLRPLLKEWLDENLPAIVERLVSTEIGKITGKRR